MRPRLIPAMKINPDLTPFQRIEQFARKIIAVPKEEADRAEQKLVYCKAE